MTGIGQFFEKLGMPRIAGQILGIMHFSGKALTLDDMVNLLEISKGSASTGTRQLMRFKLIRQVWIPGERKDYFEVTGDLQTSLEQGWREYFRASVEELRRNLEGIDSDILEDQKMGALTRAGAERCRRYAKETNESFSDPMGKAA